MKLPTTLPGFFGCVKSDCLELPIERVVKKLRLELLGEGKEILNLRGVEITPSISGSKYKCRQSSAHDSQKKNSYALLRRQSIHTNSEFNPFWEVIFQTPRYIKSLKIYNRGDRWGSRSASLHISCVDDVGSHHVVQNSCPDSARNKFVGFFASFFDKNYFDDSLKLDLRQDIIDSIFSGKSLPIDFYKHAVQGVDFRPQKVSRALDSYESTIIAGYLILQERICPGETSLKMFSHRLDSKNNLEILQERMLEISSAQNLCSYGLTRHGVQPVNILTANKKSNLSLMQKVIELYNLLGHSVVLGYGTLLGAVREGAFLSHDDDIDLIYFSACRSYEAVQQEVQGFIDYFRSLGYKVSHAIGRRLNIHIIDESIDAKVDIFPCWKTESDDLLYLHMHQMKIQAISTECLTPIDFVRLEETDFPAPKRAELFLEARYGKGWSIEDPYFDWPWKLLDQQE